MSTNKTINNDTLNINSLLCHSFTSYKKSSVLHNIVNSYIFLHFSPIVLILHLSCLFVCHDVMKWHVCVSVCHVLYNVLCHVLVLFTYIKNDITVYSKYLSLMSVRHVFMILVMNSLVVHFFCIGVLMYWNDGVTKRGMRCYTTKPNNY